MTDEMKARQRVHSLIPAYISGSVGFSLFLFVSAFIRIKLRVEPAGQQTTLELIIVSLALLVSAILIIGSAVFIIQRLWPGPSENPMQKLVGFYALGGLIAAIVGLFGSWFSFIGPVLGVGSLIYSYRTESKAVSKVRAYRIVSIIAITASVATIMILRLLPVSA
jgi:hypothetical protein